MFQTLETIFKGKAPKYYSKKITRYGLYAIRSHNLKK